jgi:peptide/nickel transport system ATP-binding protein
VPADRSPTVVATDLAIGYADGVGGMTRVVDGATFTVHPGEAVGIVGESGSGKSTLARALLGYLRGGGRFLGGGLSVAGVDVTTAPGGAIAAIRGRRVAMVPQNPLVSLTFHMPVGRQVAEVLRTRAGLSGAQAKARTLELFEEMGLPDPAAVALRHPHRLSGGQRQRVVIAAALACDPDLLVLDEPTTALDKTTEGQVLALVGRVRVARGAAMVLVTHDLNVVARTCDRVLVMREGRIVETGRVSAVFARPAASATRALLDAALDLDRAPPVAPVAAQRAILSARDLRFRYGAGWLRRAKGPPTLDRLDLDLAPGEVLGVIGESGSGKTTLGLLLAGALTPETGGLSLGGQPIAALAADRDPATRRRIQIVFQDPLSSLNPRHTVGASVARPLRTFFGLDAAEAKRRTEALFADLGLDPALMSRFPRQLSGGQQQRVAIARAFAAEPDVLVCDEITSALDASVQAQVLDHLEGFARRRGTGLVLITHDLAVVWRMAGRVLVLQGGRTVETGPTAAVFAHPTDPYTRALLDAASRVQQSRRADAVAG